MSMMQLLFWLSAFAVGYVYVGYPVLLLIWASLRPARTRRVPAARAEAPRVSIVMAARNEAARLGHTGEQRRLLAKGLTLLGGKPWTELNDFAA